MMKTLNSKQHGLHIGLEREENVFFLSLKVSGKLTHEDYEILTPMVDSALEGYEDPKIKALVDLTEMEGWELSAAWDDFKFGLKHGSEFTKIAILAHANWLKTATKIVSWFIGGEAKYFESYDEAIDWLKE